MRGGIIAEGPAQRSAAQRRTPGHPAAKLLGHPGAGRHDVRAQPPNSRSSSRRQPEGPAPGPPTLRVTSVLGPRGITSPQATCERPTATGRSRAVPRGVRPVRHRRGGDHQRRAAASGGMTANALCSLSLDPLLALVCFENDARTLPIVREAGRFAVNVLGAEQEEIARVFASKLPEAEKLEGVEPPLRARRADHRRRARLGGLRAAGADRRRRSHDRDRRGDGDGPRRRRAAALVRAAATTTATPGRASSARAPVRRSTARGHRRPRGRAARTTTSAASAITPDLALDDRRPRPRCCSSSGSSPTVRRGLEARASRAPSAPRRSAAARRGTTRAAAARRRARAGPAACARSAPARRRARPGPRPRPGRRAAAARTRRSAAPATSTRRPTAPATRVQRDRQHADDDMDVLHAGITLTRRIARRLASALET